MIPAGKLSDRIVIERKALTRNAIGEEVEVWSTLTTVWSAYRPARVSERVAGAQLQAEFDAVFRVRGPVTVTTEDRILWRGQRWDITGQPMPVDGAASLFDLFATSGVRDGR